MDEYETLLWLANGIAGRTVPVGRNEPCPCGSGKKYKKCHGPLDDEGAPGTELHNEEEEP